MRTWYGWMVAVGLGAAGCSGGGGGTTDPDSLSVEKIEITPADASTLSGKGAAPIDFSARVTWNNGEVVEDAPVSWISSNLIAGSIDQEGLFTPNANEGGVTLITAGYLGQKGTTTLTVVYTQDILEDELPASLPAQVDAAERSIDDTLAPAVVYPADNVVIPRNISGFEFQWLADEARPLHILEFNSTTTKTRVFTLSDRWAPGRELWQSIAATNSGGAFTFSAQSVEVAGAGDALQIQGPIIAPSAPIHVNISRLDSSGSIYYWEQRDERYGAIKRIGYDLESDEMKVADFYAPKRRIVDNGVEKDAEQCVSCHTISPRGDRMSVGYQADGVGYTIGLVDLPQDKDDPTPEVSPVVDPSELPLSSRGTFSPDGKYVIGVDFGRAALYDGETLKFLQPIDLGYDRVATLNFSPEGDEVIFAVPDAQSFNSDTSFFNARIAAVPFDDGIFGEPYWVTPLLEDANQFYPTYSPDGEWIVFTQSVCPPNAGPQDCDSLMDPFAELFLVARGGGDPIRLDNINDYQGPMLPPPDGEQPTPPPGQPTPVPGETPPPDGGDVMYRLSNSGPGWGPLPDANLLWLTFSSIRGYGLYSNNGEGIPQIWIAAIDPEKAAAGIDPSSPPYWLPLQDPASHNHIPQWGNY